MKKIKHLSGAWFVGTMLVAVVVTELLALQICRMFELRFSPVPIAAVSIGLVAVVVSLIYDGSE